jgi:hypothetical protein
LERKDAAFFVIWQIIYPKPSINAPEWLIIEGKGSLSLPVSLSNRVIPLGFGPRTHALKGRCSTS